MTPLRIVLAFVAVLILLTVYLFGHTPWDRGEQMEDDWVRDERMGRRRDGRTG